MNNLTNFNEEQLKNLIELAEGELAKRASNLIYAEQVCVELGIPPEEKYRLTSLKELGFLKTVSKHGRKELFDRQEVILLTTKPEYEK